VRSGDAYRASRDIELLGHDESESGEDALAELDFPGAQDNGAVIVHAQPGRQPRIGREMRRQGHES
jgi:hypothetical protein